MTGTSRAIVETDGLGKRFGSFWALQDCSLAIPAGHISALVGANGAGKTTLLRLLLGLTAPSAGVARICGQPPRQQVAFLRDVGYLAQDMPLYRRLTVADHLAIGAHLNPRWDDAEVRHRLDELGIGLHRRVATLSGGQRSQVALGLALAKRPRLLLLDEPVAALDPLARRQFLTSLTAAVAEEGMSVILSTHLLRDVEPVCDHVVLLANSRLCLCDTVEEVLAAHRVLVGPHQHVPGLSRWATVITATHTTRQSTLVVRTSAPPPGSDLGGFEQHPADLEEVILGYMAGDPGGGTGPLAAVKEAS